MLLILLTHIQQGYYASAAIALTMCDAQSS